ncbi:hypothetical protein CPC08DRAFT_730871 [Agrocybe pediades]|nr:hypothetical protein CPC08DRAFT_730871 [Agrocybe pediades]
MAAGDPWDQTRTDPSLGLEHPNTRGYGSGSPASALVRNHPAASSTFERRHGGVNATRRDVAKDEGRGWVVKGSKERGSVVGRRGRVMGKGRDGEGEGWRNVGWTNYPAASGEWANNTRRVAWANDEAARPALGGRTRRGSRRGLRGLPRTKRWGWAVDEEAGLGGPGDNAGNTSSVSSEGERE